MFCAVALVAGTAGTTVVGHLAGTFTLTWPAALFAAMQSTVAVIYAAERPPEPRRRTARRWSRLAGAVFLAFCLGYYELCKGVGLATGWTFLMGFLPAYPLTVGVARARQRSQWFAAALLLVAFSVYYWASVLFIAWKSNVQSP